MLDSANLKDLGYSLEHYPISGVTTNPSILKAEGQIDLRDHYMRLRDLCNGRSLHIQLLSRQAEDMLREAEVIVNLLGSATYVKVPVTEQGLKAIQKLKKKGLKVTATAVYSFAQGALAVASGADYIAPYCNRMENNEISFRKVVEDLRTVIDRDGYNGKILAASFKNMGQVNDALVCGAHAVTLQPALLNGLCASPLVADAVCAFEADYALFHNRAQEKALTTPKA